jgi:uncharacterized membrane protein YgcG
MMKDKRGGASEDGTTRGDMTVEEEARLKKKVTKGVWGMAKDKANIQVAEMKVQSYEEAFNKIKQSTGISDIDELVTTFIQNEDQNFSLFNYVNEQNNEVEKLEEQIQVLHEEEHKYTQESGDDVHQHKQLLKDLESKLQSTENAAEKYEMKYQDSAKTINSLKVGIFSLFNKLSCMECSMADLLSDSNVTDANMMQFLGIIEQRTNEILQMYATMQAKDGADHALHGIEDHHRAAPPPPAIVGILGQGPTTPMGQEAIQINPPNLDDYSSEEESDSDQETSRPLTHDELKARTMKVIHKRATAGGGGGGGRSGGGGGGRSGNRRGKGRY